MRRRQIFAQQSEMRPAALPGTGADVRPGVVHPASPASQAPQGITYQHNERTTVTLPAAEFRPDSVKLGDEVSRMGGLDRAIAMIEANSPPGPVHIDFNPKPVQVIDPKRAKKLAALEKARAVKKAKRGG